MGSSGSASDATVQEAETVFSGLEQPCRPLSTAEVARELDCDEATASATLEELSGRGTLCARRLENGLRVWWRPADGDQPSRGHERGSQETGADGQDRPPEDAFDEAEFQSFVEAVSDYAIFLLDPDGNVASWNDGAERIKGYEPEEILGEHFSAFYTEDDVAEGVPETNLERAATRGRFEDEGWRVRADGTEFWANVVITAIRDDDGELQGYTKVTRDMTERREYERRLRRERDQTEQLLRTAPVAIAVQDSDGETILTNRRAREEVGSDDAPFVADAGDLAWSRRDASGDRLTDDETPWTRALATGEPVFGEEVAFVAHDGDERVYQIHAAPILDADGTVERVVTVGEDVTELKRRERELERRKAGLETELSEVLGRISDAFYAVDREWHITHVNERAAELLGRDRDALHGRELWSVVPDAADVSRERFERAMDTQEPESFEVRLGDTETWLEFTAYPSESGLSVYFRDVTERKDREQELSRYETLFTESTDVNAVLNPDGTFQYLPPSVENVLGYGQNELLGEDTFEYVHPDDRERIAMDFQRMAEDPEYRPLNEFRYRHADGHWVWLEARGRNLLDDPNIEGLVAYTRDITERKEREQELERTERRFEAVFEDPNILVGLLEPDGTVLDINGTAMDYVEAGLADVRGEPFWETPWWGAGDDVQAEVREWVERAAAGEYVDFEADLTQPDGERYTIEGVFRPVTNDDGDVVSVIVSDRDVTERKEQKRQLVRLVENVPGMVYHCHNEHGWPMSFVSEACEALTGYDPAAIERGDVSWGGDVIVDADREMVWDDVQAGLAVGETFSVTYRIETASGDTRWVRDYGRGVFDGDGECTAIEGIIADITEEKRLETELQESERRYRAIAEYFPNGIVTLFDEDLRYELAAGRGFADIPVSASDLEGSHVSEAWDERTAEALEPLFEAALAGEERTVELEYVGRDWVVHAVPITDEGGEVFAGMTMAQDITERKDRERELREREQRLASQTAYTDAIIDAIDDLFYVLDQDGTLRRWNESLAEITGYADETIASMTAADFFPEGEGEAAMAAVREGFESGVANVELTVETRDGEEIPFEFSASTVEAPGGETVLAGIGRDVSDRVERERKLAESERRYRTLAQNFPNGAVGVYDRDLRYTLAEGAKMETDLPPADEIEGNRMPDVFPEHVVTDLEPLFRAAIEEGETDSTTTQFNDRDWRVWAAPLVGADGEIFGGLSFAQDVTERVERKEHLQRYETIVEAVEDGVYVVDADGYFTMVNEAYAEMVGYEPAELVGSHVSLVVDETVGSRARELEDEMTTAGADRPTLEAELETRAGELIPAEASFAMLPEGDDTWHRVGVARDISARKERERKLAESERRYRTLVENFPGGAVGLFDENLEYTAVGGQFLDEVEVNPDERIGNSVYEIYPEDIVTEVEPHFEAALRGETNTFEVQFHDRYLHAQTLPVGDPDDEIVGGMLVVQDVTERREARHELRESEAKFRMLAENLDEIVWMTTEDIEEFLYINPVFEDVWGIDRAELYDEPLAFLEAVHEDDRERVREAFTALPETDFADEFRIVRPDGEVRWVHARGARVTDADGEMVRVVGIGDDITSRVERERELERALDLLEKTERIADVGGWEVDVETRDVFWTDHIFELLDVPDGEAPPLEDALGMYHEQDRQDVEEAIEDAMAAGKPFDIEARVRTETDEIRWLRLQGVPEVDADGEATSLRGAAQDVTERKRREQRLEELIDRLEESNERLEQFAYAASHDLQEPLRMVSSYLQLVERRYGDELDAEGREFLEFAVDGADRMREMIDGLLAYSRVDTRGDPFEPLDLESVLADARDDLQVKIDEHDAEVTTGALPRVQGDPGQLRQLFQNLLDNAIDYSGDDPPRVHVAAEREGDHVRVSVRDEGIGMNPDEAERIFEVFKTLHTREDRGGTGIGLALCERIVERHDGEITVESAPGEGSTFTFTLPTPEGVDD